MYRYEVRKIRPLFTSSDLYGILVTQKLNGKWIETAVVAPFSSDREAIVQLAEQCTSLQLDPEHLVDAISNFLTQTATDR